MEPAVEKHPGVDSIHFDAPDKLYFPAGQSIGQVEVAPILGDTQPALTTSHVPEDATEYWPGAQLKHDAEFIGDHVPAGHFPHIEEPDAANWPGGH